MALLLGQHVLQGTPASPGSLFASDWLKGFDLAAEEWVRQGVKELSVPTKVQPQQPPPRPRSRGLRAV